MIEQQLRDLATRRDSAAPFLSLYIDTNRNDESQKDRIRVWVKDEARKIRAVTIGNGHDELVEKGINQIQQYVEHALEPTTRGLAVFVCPAEDVFIPLQLPVPVEPQLTIGNRPHLRPLMQLKHSFPPVIVAMIDGKSARLFELEFGRVLFELDLEQPDMPRRHDQGGWSQANMQRHVQDHVNRHHKEAAEILTRLVDQGRARTVILSGQERNVANFRTFLPKRVDERIAGALRLDIRSGADEVIAATQELIRAAQLGDLEVRLMSTEESARKNGRGAVGIDAVVDAINQRKVETLFLAQDAQAQGWKCTRCGTLGRQVPLGCPACGGSVMTIDLVEELISGAEKEDAKLEFVPPGSLLDRYEGVAAALRF